MTSGTDVRRSPQPASLPDRDSLDVLSFPAALVDGDGILESANPEWLRAHPAATTGISLVSWWVQNHPAGPPVAAELQRLLDRAEGVVAREYWRGPEPRRVLIAAYPGGALIIEHSLAAAAADPRSQKMEAVGRLVGGVAHDFANLLTLIAGYSEMLLGRIGAKDPTRPEMEEIRAAAERGSRLTDQLLGFLRGEAAQPHPLDLNEIVREMQSMLRPIIGEHVEMTAVLAPDLDPVVADAGQMEQVLLNLVLNARDAMPEGGRIAIETCNCDMTGAVAAAHRVAPGRYAILSVSDTGHGIPAESLSRIFEPFFTTKEKDKGTGLGLSTVHGIVKRAGGDIWAASRPGSGSAFSLCLPSAKGGASHAIQTDGRTAGIPVGSETILVVEDEESVRGVLAKALRRQGYRVLEAADGVEAMQTFEAHDGEIRLVLTDMVMPRMNGRELSERLRKLRPDLRVMHMSGYLDADPVGGGLAPGTAFLQKPVRLTVLAEKIREALDSPA